MKDQTSAAGLDPMVYCARLSCNRGCEEGFALHLKGLVATLRPAVSLIGSVCYGRVYGSRMMAVCASRCCAGGTHLLLWNPIGDAQSLGWLPQDPMHLGANSPEHAAAFNRCKTTPCLNNSHCLLGFLAAYGRRTNVARDPPACPADMISYCFCC